MEKSVLKKESIAIKKTDLLLCGMKMEIKCLNVIILVNGMEENYRKTNYILQQWKDGSFR